MPEPAAGRWPFRVGFDMDTREIVVWMAFGAEPEQTTRRTTITSLEALAVAIAEHRHEAFLQRGLADQLARAGVTYLGADPGRLESTVRFTVRPGNRHPGQPDSARHHAAAAFGMTQANPQGARAARQAAIRLRTRCTAPAGEDGRELSSERGHIITIRAVGLAISTEISDIPTSRRTAMNTSTSVGSAADAVDLDLDVRIVPAGPVAVALLSSTDDGCDTKTDGDC